MDSIKCAKQSIRAIISKSSVPEDSFHSENVLKWIINLKSDADEALQIAALAHDIDRADEHKKIKRNNFSDYNKFKSEHAKNSANILKGILIKCNVKQSIIDEKWSNSPVLIIRDHGNNFMGMVGLTQNHFLPGNFELGYQFPEKAWGKGIATLATEYALNIAFNTLEAYKVNADCYGENIGSKKVLEKSGFIQEGCQKEYYKLDFIIDDKALYGITRQQFIEFQKKK